MPLDEGIVNSLPEDIRKDPSFTEIQKGDLPGVFKNLIDSQKTLGRAVILPDEKDSPENRSQKLNSVYERLGRPKTHTEYDYKEIIKDEHSVEPERLEKFNQVFHKAGLSKSQASEIVRAYMEDVASQELTINSLLEDLKTDWGDESKIKDGIGTAKKALALAGETGEKLLAFLEQTTLGNHPAIIRYLNWVGSNLKEDAAPRLENRGGSLDREGAQSKVTEIMNNRQHPYWNRGMAGHQEALAEVKKLNEVIHGTKVVVTVGEK